MDKYLYNNSHENIAKQYLLNLPSKNQFDDIIYNVMLDNIEKQIIIERFKNYSTIRIISEKLFISIPYISKKQKSALKKIYNYLVYKKYI